MDMHMAAKFMAVMTDTEMNRLLSFRAGNKEFQAMESSSSPSSSKAKLMAVMTDTEMDRLPNSRAGNKEFQARES
jgi:hypothetical protein